MMALFFVICWAVIILAKLSGERGLVGLVGMPHLPANKCTARKTMLARHPSGERLRATLHGAALVGNRSAPRPPAVPAR